MKLPGGDNVEIDQRKLTEYALSPTHPVGKHKARLFALKLGLTRDDAPALIEALRAVAVSNDATATEHDVWGQRYSIDFYSALISVLRCSPVAGSFRPTAHLRI